jgi:hypothetical protein
MRTCPEKWGRVVPLRVYERVPSVCVLSTLCGWKHLCRESCLLLLFFRSVFQLQRVTNEIQFVVNYNYLSVMYAEYNIYLFICILNVSSFITVRVFSYWQFSSPHCIYITLRCCVYYHNHSHNHHHHHHQYNYIHIS